VGEGVGEGVLSTCQSNPLRVDPSSSPSRGGGPKKLPVIKISNVHMLELVLHI
jgi:hypothetical protein